jgi:hypothetical protein
MSTAYHFTPTDRSAETLKDFLATCRVLPDVAGQHLAAGWFEAWLSDQGRGDLARHAAEVRCESDGLARFLKLARPTRAPRTSARTSDPVALPTKRRSRKAAA